MNATANQLLKQFLSVRGKDWMPHFEQAAKTGKTSTAHTLGIGSRETNLKNIKGDYRNGKYNGFGVMQVDIGTDPEYAKNWSPTNAKAGIVRGGEIYLSKINDTRACVGKTVKVRSKSFVGKAVEPDDLRRISTAAYNCGRWAHYHFSRGEHIDSTTTGGDYSRDVYDRAIHFAAMLQGQTIETRTVKKKTVCRLVIEPALAVTDENALENEIRLQGKYCRPEHAALIGQIQPERESLPVGLAQATPGDLARVDCHAEPVDFPGEPEPTPAVEVSTTEKRTENGQTVEEKRTNLNEQPVNEVVPVPEPKPQGFVKKLVAGIGTIFGGTLIYDAAGKFSGVQFTWQTVAIICFVIFLAFIGFIVWAILDAWKANKRVEHTVFANTAKDRKDIVFVPNGYKPGDFVAGVDQALASVKPTERASITSSEIQGVSNE